MDFFKKSEEKSEGVIKQLREVEAKHREIEEEKVSALQDKNLRELFITLHLGERLLESHDPALENIRKELESRKREIQEKATANRSLHNQLSKELFAITRPVIEKGIEKLGLELVLLKLQKKVIDRSSGGFSMIPRVTVESNEDALGKIKGIVRDGISTLRGMGSEPISKIESFVQEKLAEIRAVDLSPHQKEIDAFENERRDWITSPVR